MVETLDEWPTKEDAPPSPLLKYMDGKVYKFTAEDAESLGYATTGTWGFENALYALKNDLMLVARTEFGPWRAKSVTVHDELVFQFTGLRDCRKNGCVVTAEEGGNGFCLEHQKEKSNG